jgi:hypothetical protein
MSTTEFTKGDFKPLEEGEYMVRMNRITNKTTKKGDPALSIGFQVMKKVGDTNENESKAKNRLIFDYLVLEHSNPKVVEITNEKIDKYLKAIGQEKGLEGIGHDVSKLEEYLDLPFIAKVKIEAGTNGYKDSNKITSFKRR